MSQASSEPLENLVVTAVVSPDSAVTSEMQTPREKLRHLDPSSYLSSFLLKLWIIE